VLADEILGTPRIEGLTLTGGEPFAQARALVRVARRVREAGLSVMAFTGYELDELTWPDAEELLAHCDIVVAGRFVRELRTSVLPWLGSSNQRVHFLTSRYDQRMSPPTGQCEAHMGANGSVLWTGFPEEGLVRTT